MHLTKLVFFVSLVFMSLTLSSFADEYRGTATFSVNDLNIIKADGLDFVELKDGVPGSQIGAPALPVIQMDVAIPWNALINEVSVIRVETIEIDGRFDVAPITTPMKLSATSEDLNPFVKDPLIYRKDSFFPGTYADFLTSWDIVGQKFAKIAFNPVQYNPVSGKLMLATRIDFQLLWGNLVQPEEQPTFNLTQAGKEYYEKFMKSKAMNPDDISIPEFNGSSSRALPSGQYEHVIITPQVTEAYWADLVEWHTKKGLPDITVTKEYIYANYSGGTNQGKIRNFIIDAHSTWGTRYFLIGADGGDGTYQIPYHLRTISQVDPDPVPNDTYYADYNANWVVDVNVGRATINTQVVHITNFIDKIFHYEKTPSTSNYCKEVFFMGFDLDGSTEGEDTKIHIKNNYVPARMSFQSEYDSESGAHLNNVISYLNNGPNLANHIDHCGWDVWGMGSVNHGGYMYAYHVNSLTNGWKLINWYTLGCHASAWDHSTSLSETFMRLTGGAGISFTGNTRYGWYNPGYYNTLSALYDIRWWHVLFTDNEYHVGETLTAHKNDYYPGDNYYKYIFTELNLLGEPMMPLWTDDPAALSVTYDDSIPVGSQSYSVNVKKSGANLSGALVCLWKGAEVYVYGSTNASGNAAFTINPTTAGNMFVTATAQNCLPHEGEAAVETGGPPTVTGITPEHGGIGGQTACTITGSNFTTTPDTTVAFGGYAASNVSVLNSTTITCNSPAHSAGTVGVTVTNGNGSDTLPSAFTFHNPPSVSSLDPDGGPLAGGSTVTITGSDFTSIGSTSVTFGGTAASSVNVISSTTITCTTPAHSAGTVDVTVTNDFGNDTLQNGFTYFSPPVVTSVDPDHGPANGGTFVTISGNYFDVPGTTSVTFGGAPASSVNVVSSTSITCYTPAHGSGAVNVTVTNDYGSDTLAGGYTYSASPMVVYVDPPQGPIVGGTAVTVYGSNFTSTFDTDLTFGGIDATNVNVVNYSTITCNTPANSSGLVDVTVTNSYGSGTLSNGFLYEFPPEIYSIVPEDGHSAGGTAVTIYGSNFTSTFDTSIDFGGANATTVNVIDYGTITCNTPAHSAGLVDLSVTSTNGTGILWNAFTFHNPPGISSVYPDNGPMAGGTSVTISGNDFTSTADTTVTFGGVSAVSMNVVNSSTITCSTPASGTAGSVDVFVSNTWGSDTLVDGFDYNAPPEITGVTPATGLMATTVPITITGNHFLPSGYTNVVIGGEPATNVTVVNDNTITCDTPEYPIPDVVDVEIANSNGADTLSDGFEFIPPTGAPPMNLTDVDTLNVYPGDIIRLSITGQPGAAYAVFISLGGGPTPSQWGIMGLGAPLHLWTATLNTQGYITVPIEMSDPEIGFFNFYIHALVDDSPLIWATGGNNPNGSGSIKFGLNSSSSP